ncbi:hypothetical protein DPEC_G00021780 [Dallia pectoralis]|uniref:Uncharacterized protein n=1 Tax=Dallia pectoralis TaxID=75939 RepID=A0ACC2HGC6_DALPE|nr:hypothetical protein DPEC_G00021780 [Dallia pectoralis]
MIRNIPTISTFFKSRLVDANQKPGGACCACDASNEEFSITASSLAISDEPEPDLLERQHQHDKKIENNSPAGVTDTCPSAPPPAQSRLPVRTKPKNVHRKRLKAAETRRCRVG